MNPQEKLTARVQSMTTDQLIKVTLRLAAPTSSDEIILSTFVDQELENRLSESDFVALMTEVERIMDAAA